MRVLFATSPGLGHVFPTISLAHALRAAGHEVLFTTAGGVEAARAGLHVVDTAPGVDIGELFRKYAADNDISFDQMRAETGDGWKFAAGMFAVVSDVTADRTVDAAKQWRPDLVVHSPLQGAGALAASAIGVPAVEHGLSMSELTGLDVALFEEMSATYERHGVSKLPEVTEQIAVGPPSMRDGDSGWQMRYVPYNGGGVLPEWLLEPTARPRVAITLGTVVPLMGGVGSLRRLIDIVGGLDADFVVALGEADQSELGSLPDNVRATAWVPLGALLASCSAMIHHGGAGTTMTGIVAGVPQLVMPYMADQPANAAAVRDRGLGLVGSAEDVTEEQVRALLEDESLRTTAHEVRDEIAALPTPADLVSKLAGLVS
ncbi:DUF1205 domain-containing protein [Solihabitans fulvus]|uniref:DUF1205 domain-containing protein n=1 Tax=Solihabitans fulvus TaxID=1892852 RepID=A0A5B2WS25_9PSEU|nr:nucleotide disphospho-sugar-binding domain-containing protein [Solihabitans fulvus]KAA2254325.1 DUF1205 domain-containing protein [Solihabitans fulvus]